MPPAASRVPLTCVPTSPCRREQVLGVTHSSGLGDPGPVQWPLALCLLAAWIVVFLCMMKGIRSSGKVSRAQPGLGGAAGA